MLSMVYQLLSLLQEDVRQEASAARHDAQEKWAGRTQISYGSNCYRGIKVCYLYMIRRRYVRRLPRRGMIRRSSRRGTAGELLL